ncbi:sulfonate ABC transporter substrate-binding protein [Parvibium lacunae]|nr:sulfonate ABC transporter substrate-binding protein [Parvibium lacunae]
MTTFKQTRRAVVLGAIGGTALVLASKGRAQSLPAVAVAPAQIRIGFQKSAVNLVLLKQRGVLEQRFKNSKVSWIEFPAGPQLLEALAVGSVDFGLTGDSPPVFAQAAGKDLLYVGAEPPKPESSAILVPATSSINNLADLKGKRIAFQKGSSAHYLVLRALEKGQVAWSDIQPAYLTPAEARAAFERGSVDAWAIWDPFYAAAEVAIKPRVLTTGSGLAENNSFYLAARGFVENSPHTIRDLLQALTEADHYAQTNRKEAAKIIAEFTGLDLATSFRFLGRRPPSKVDLLSSTIIAQQQRVADAFFKLGLIPKSIRVADVVWQPKK